MTALLWFVGAGLFFYLYYRASQEYHRVCERDRPEIERRAREFQLWPTDRGSHGTSATEAVPPKRDSFPKSEERPATSTHKVASRLGGVITPTPGTPLPPETLDLRSETEKQIEISARQGQSKGAEIDSLIEELIQIGRSDKFLSENTDGGRAREIGAILNSKGGMDLMKFAYYRVGRVLGGGQMRTLEVAWDNIGEWMS